MSPRNLVPAQIQVDRLTELVALPPFPSVLPLSCCHVGVARDRSILSGLRHQVLGRRMATVYPHAPVEIGYSADNGACL